MTRGPSFLFCCMSAAALIHAFIQTSSGSDLTIFHVEHEKGHWGRGTFVSSVPPKSKQWYEDSHENISGDLFMIAHGDHNSKDCFVVEVAGDKMTENESSGERSMLCSEKSKYFRRKTCKAGVAIVFDDKSKGYHLKYFRWYNRRPKRTVAAFCDGKDTNMKRVGKNDVYFISQNKAPGAQPIAIHIDLNAIPTTSKLEVEEPSKTQGSPKSSSSRSSQGSASRLRQASLGSSLSSSTLSLDQGSTKSQLVVEMPKSQLVVEMPIETPKLAEAGNPFYFIYQSEDITKSKSSGPEEYVLNFEQIEDRRLQKLSRRVGKSEVHLLVTKNLTSARNYSFHIAVKTDRDYDENDPNIVARIYPIFETFRMEGQSVAVFEIQEKSFGLRQIFRLRLGQCEAHEAW